MIAVLTAEPQRQQILDTLLSAPKHWMSAASYLEVCIVVDSRRDPVLSRNLDALLETLKIDLAPVTAKQARIAREAYRDLGRGSGHPARLNFGDCFAYALARDSDETLLFVGDDFTQTDIRPALRV